MESFLDYRKVFEFTDQYKTLKLIGAIIEENLDALWFPMHAKCYTTELWPQLCLQVLWWLYKHIQQKEN